MENLENLLDGYFLAISRLSFLDYDWMSYTFKAVFTEKDEDVTMGKDAGKEIHLIFDYYGLTHCALEINSEETGPVNVLFPTDIFNKRIGELTTRYAKNLLEEDKHFQLEKEWVTSFYNEALANRLEAEVVQ